jgi:hypothetical protein
MHRHHPPPLQTKPLMNARGASLEQRGPSSTPALCTSWAGSVPPEALPRSGAPSIATFGAICPQTVARESVRILPSDSFASMHCSDGCFCTRSALFFAHASSFPKEVGKTVLKYEMMLISFYSRFGSRLFSIISSWQKPIPPLLALMRFGRLKLFSMVTAPLLTSIIFVGFVCITTFLPSRVHSG